MTIFLSFCEIILFMTLFLSIYLAQNISTTKAVFVPKGNISFIIAYLNKQNAQILPVVDKIILRMIGKPQAGWIDLKTTLMSKGDFLYRLTSAKAYTKQIMIYPGETSEVVLKILADNYDLSFEKLKLFYEQKAPFKEGVIIPETYNIPIGISEKELIKYLINSSLRIHKKLSKKIFRVYDEKQWKKYLTIASIIQKEAGNNKEMSLVSSVIYNRLKKGMKLQMDGALNYGKFSHQKITPKRIKTDESRFNTYKFEGLPPYPVCLVSLDAIKAAIKPQKSDFLYFIRDKSSKNNSHIFTKTYTEHVNEINRQRKL